MILLLQDKMHGAKTECTTKTKKAAVKLGHVVPLDWHIHPIILLDSWKAAS